MSGAQVLQECQGCLESEDRQGSEGRKDIQAKMDGMECLGVMVRAVPWGVQDTRELVVSLADQGNLVRQAGTGVTEMMALLACGGR